MKIRVAIIAALIVAIFGVPRSAPPAISATLLPVRLGAMPIDTSAEAYYAIDQGFFTAAGLDVTLTVLSNGSATATAVSAGSLDIGFASPSTLMSAHEHGLPIWFIAPAAVWDGTSNNVLMVPKGSPIHSGADFTGKTIAVAGLHDLAQYALEAWIDRNGGNSSAVQFFELPYAQMGLALQQGRVAAAAPIQPFSGQMSADATILGNISLSTHPYLQAGWFAMGPYIEKNPEVVRRFVLAMRQAAHWGNTHPKESGAILGRYSKIDPAQMAGTPRAHYDEDARFDPRLLQPVIDVMVRYGKADPISATNLIWPAFLSKTPPAR